MAIGMYNYLKDTDYQIGKHIHIIGFDNTEVSHYTVPRLTTIDYSKQKWGSIAAGNLLKLIANQAVEHGEIYVKMVEGESVS